jgi:predicted site-specific integrase-resolvase
VDNQCQDRIQYLAQSLDCLSEHDLLLLADITPATAENWRKRGKGPAYVLLGNRYLYPRAAVAAYLNGNVRERRESLGKAVL